MTPREKADAIVAELRRLGSGWSGDLSSAIEHAIVAAIIGEREACRKIAQTARIREKALLAQSEGKMTTPDTVKRFEWIEERINDRNELDELLKQ